MIPKKYYWLRFKEDFFKQKEIKKLRKIAGGDTFTIIYLKMQLLTVKTDGIIKYDGIEDTFAEEIALELDEEVDNVKITLSFLQNTNLMEVISGNEYLLPEALKNIGSESDSAERVRNHRSRKALQCNAQVTNCNTELEIKKEIEINTMPNGKKDNPLFDAFWTAYPRKDGKGQAKKAYASQIRKGTSHELIMERLKIYIAQLQAAKTERQFMRHPATFLNNLDDYEQAPSEPEESEFMRLHKPKPMTDEEREMIMRSYNHA